MFRALKCLPQLPIVPITMVRFQDPEKFIPRMITNVIDGEKIPIYGDGKYARDWLYVDDHSRAIEQVVLKGKLGETYCVGE